MKRNHPSSYSDIPIPEQLDQVIDQAAARARRTTRRRPLIRTGLCAAAALCLLTVTANSPLAAQAMHIPIVGSVVKILRVGTGGQSTDGLAVHAQAQSDRVELSFTRTTGTADTAPFYNAARYLAPNRVVLTLHGVRIADRQAILTQLTNSPAVQDAYFGMILDDSAVLLTVELNDGYDCQITERAEPAGLTLDFTPVTQPASDAPVYYLRSEAMPYGESLGIFCERLMNQDCSQVRVDENNYVVMLGQYSSEDEAQDALTQLEQTLGGASGLWVSSSLPNERPDPQEKH